MGPRVNRFGQMVMVRPIQLGGRDVGSADINLERLPAWPTPARATFIMDGRIVLAMKWITRESADQHVTPEARAIVSVV